MLALLSGLALIGVQATAQEREDAPKTKEATKAVYVVGVTGMT
jgi:hypothetical protein